MLPPRRAGASAGPAGFGQSPEERPGGRGLPGAREEARRKRGRARPAEGAEREGRGVAMEEGGGAGRCQGPPLRSLRYYGSAGSAGMELS